MALHLITGYAGREHITSADQGAYNIATFGDGNIVFDRGQKFKATVKNNNTVNIADGEAMLQGRFVKMPVGTTEDVTITNGTQGRYRNDLICIRYEKSVTDSTESTKLIVIKGTESTGTPSDPTYNNGKITDGTANIADFPLYRVSLSGINVSSVTPLFSVVVSMAKYMSDYQMPLGSKSQAGALKVGTNLSVNNGTVDYTLPTATASQKGGIKLGEGLKIEGDVVGVNISRVSGDVTSETFTIPANGRIGSKDIVLSGAGEKDFVLSAMINNLNGGNKLNVSCTVKNCYVAIYNGVRSYIAQVQFVNHSNEAVTINSVRPIFTVLK